MLSADRGNLNLWNAYASLEIGRHRYDAARTVFANALSFSQAERGASVVSEDELDLLAAWVQMESDSGQFARAVDLLVHAAAGEAVDYGMFHLEMEALISSVKSESGLPAHCALHHAVS